MQQTVQTFVYDAIVASCEFSLDSCAEECYHVRYFSSHSIIIAHEKDRISLPPKLLRHTRSASDDSSTAFGCIDRV